MTPEDHDVYPGPLRRFLAAVAKDPDVVGKWWPDGPGGPGGPSKGKYANLWGALSQPQRDVLQSGSLDEITAAVDAEAEKFPNLPGEAVDSAKGLAWALVRV
jgi:hypothetical protein